MRVSSLPKAGPWKRTGRDLNPRPFSRPLHPPTYWIASERSTVKPAFHDADTDTDILADTLSEDRREDVSVVECGLYATQLTVSSVGDLIVQLLRYPTILTQWSRLRARLPCCRLTTLAKLFTPMCRGLCHQAV